MATQTKSFKELLWAFSQASGRNPNPSAGTVDTTPEFIAQAVDLLNRAVDDCWRPTTTATPESRAQAFAWPETITTSTVTTADGAFSRDDIDGSDFYSAWADDPRPLFANGDFYNYLRLRIVEDSSGLWAQKADPAVTNPDIFVFSRLATPVFSTTPVTPGDTYNTVGTVVYNDGTGRVYKSRATGALGNDLTDETKWTEQTLPINLFKMALYKADAYRFEMKGVAEVAAQKHAQAAQAMQVEFDRIAPNINEWPLWLWRP